jgi:hypothetical protein
MKILFLDTALIFRVVPRIYPLFNDILVLELRNELTGVIFTPNFTFSIDEYLTITMESIADFEIQNKYNFKIRNNNEIISSGKILILREGTSVQDYNYQEQEDEYYTY